MMAFLFRVLFQIFVLERVLWSACWLAHCCQQPCILFSNSTNILTVQAVNLTNQQPVSIISNLSRAIAIDVHINRKLIFWSDVSDKNIKRANVDGSNIMTIVQNRTGVIDGLAVEWTTGLLYWTDTAFDKIEVAHLDGSSRKVLVEDNLDQPRGIAVDPQAGLMFWTDWGATPKIECAYLNAENRHAVVSSSLGWPNDITLDYSTQKMYWVDAKTDKIEYAGYTGVNRRQIFSSSGLHPFGVDIYSSWLYWTEWSLVSQLYQIDRSSGNLNSSARVSGRVCMGLVVMHSSRQPSFSNGCQTNNGGCSFLCLLKPIGCTCEFANGRENKTCGFPAVTTATATATATATTTTTAAPTAKAAATATTAATTATTKTATAMSPNTSTVSTLAVVFIALFCISLLFIVIFIVYIVWKRKKERRENQNQRQFDNDGSLGNMNAINLQEIDHSSQSHQTKAVHVNDGGEHHSHSNTTGMPSTDPSIYENINEEFSRYTTGKPFTNSTGIPATDTTGMPSTDPSIYANINEELSRYTAGNPFTNSAGIPATSESFYEPLIPSSSSLYESPQPIRMRDF